ncbi:MAG: CAP domain-containing protein [Bacteroidia bacterium]|nr:CAP domain-containing protein [Bacteroidia bacterium]
MLILLSIPLSWSQEKHTLPEDKINKEQLLNLVNQIRAEGCQCGDTYMPPVPPLKWNDTLAKSAFLHSKDMVDKNYHSHYSLDGKGPNQRAYKLKYTSDVGIGENICAGAENEVEAVNGWKGSPEHCKNMMNEKWTEMGIGMYKGRWTQVFGGKKQSIDKK